jgi:hypothetical protein
LGSCLHDPNLFLSIIRSYDIMRANNQKRVVSGFYA